MNGGLNPCCWIELLREPSKMENNVQEDMRCGTCFSFLEINPFQILIFFCVFDSFFKFYNSEIPFFPSQIECVRTAFIGFQK